MAEYEEKLVIICDIENEDDRFNELFDFIDAIIPEARDVDFDDEYDELETEYDDDTNEDGDLDYDRDYIKDGRHHDLDDRLEHFCDMTDEEKRQFFEDHPRFLQFSDRLANYCDLSGDEREDALERFADEHINDEDRTRTIDSDFRDKLARWCEMSDKDKRATAAEYDKTADQIVKADRYCNLGETDRADFIEEHRDEFVAKMRDKMHDKMTDRPHMDYDRLCDLADSDRAAEITDSAKLDRISKWCEMTPEEREDYKKEYHDDMKDKVTDHMKDKMMDKISDHCDTADCPMKDRMHDNISDRLVASGMTPRLKAMIMEKHDISDERLDEIKMKYLEKHGELSDEKRSDLKMKYRDHMSKVRDNMSDERKSDIHDRIADMKAFKAELRDRASEMTDEEKQELRADFIEKAKDMQLAWISPRTQMHAGVDSADIECREGFSLVMKASNGVAMCLKADSALKMIDRGIVVPAI